MKIRTASRFILWFLRLNGVLAVTLPWKTIHIRPGHEGDADLLKHEMVHLKQIERDGALVWTIKIFWYLLRYGYRNSPYEREARGEG